MTMSPAPLPDFHCRDSRAWRTLVLANGSELDEVVVTNTISMDNKQKECPKLTVLTVAPLLGEAIKRIHEEASVSSLFV